MQLAASLPPCVVPFSLACHAGAEVWLSSDGRRAHGEHVNPVAPRMPQLTTIVLCVLQSSRVLVRIIGLADLSNAG